MPKQSRTIRVTLPGYQKDRSRWRQRILDTVLDAGITCDDDEPLEVVVLLYMTKGKRIAIHDVDNRLKDILDALQGRFGSRRARKRLIENDNRVHRAVIEKQPIPKGFSEEAGGDLLIRPYQPRRCPLQRTTGDRLRKSKPRHTTAQ